MSELFEDVEGVKAIVDDLLIWRKNDAEHNARLKQVVNRASEVNLKFNAKKCRIRQEEVRFVGHVLSKEGLKPDPKKVRAVQEMHPPENTKELNSFLGFIQYLAKFMPNKASVDGLLFRAQWLIVPHSWRYEMLDRIHELHQGIAKYKQRARDILFWSGMLSQIEDKVFKCSICK